MKTWIAAAILTCAMTACHSPEATVWKLYYLGGQSNMDGYGDVTDLPETLQEPLPGIMIFHGNTSPDGTEPDGNGVWAELRPGHGAGFSSDGTINSHSEQFGIELSFAERMRQLDPGANIALIKYSRGGTSIDAEAAGQFGAWDPDDPTGTGVNQYDHFLATIRLATAVQDIDGDGHPDLLVPSGIVWMQGESDGAYSEAIARRYEANLEQLIDLVRAALRVDDLPAVIGRISDSGQDDDGRVWDHGDIVRAAQAAFVEKDPRAALVTSTDSYGYSDPWHYDSNGYLDLGRRFADALAELERRASTPRE